MFEKDNFNIFWCNLSDPNFDLFKYLGKINLHISTLLEKKCRKWREDEDFKKIDAVTKLKDLKRYAKNILPNYKKWRTHNQR